MKLRVVVTYEYDVDLSNPDVKEAYGNPKTVEDLIKVEQEVMDDDASLVPWQMEVYGYKAKVLPGLGEQVQAGTVVDIL